MPLLADKRGMLLFGAIVLVVLLGCFAAYVATGDKSIEERFTQAVGLQADEEEEGEGGGLFGFNIEGNLLVYAIVLVILVIACVLLYRRFGL